MCKCNNCYRDDKLHHECGVLGIYGVPDAANLAYYGLHTLQHRGQQGCGIVTVDSEGLFHRVKGDGLVTEVFNEQKMSLARSLIESEEMPICRIAEYLGYNNYNYFCRVFKKTFGISPTKMRFRD